MAKPDPALLDPARYPFSCQIETRFGDLDTNLHINNVALAGLIEEGRVRFHRASNYHQATEGMTSMVASLGIEFLGQSHFPEPLEMHVAATRIGRTSYQLVQLVTQQGRIVAYAQTVLVCMQDNQPIAVPPIFLESIKSWMLKP
jgi:acyl-CoA thioester hydrolase